MNRKITLFIDEKSCDNCGDSVVCFAAGKSCDAVCANWQLGYSDFENLVEQLSPDQQDLWRKYPLLDFEVVEKNNL